MKRFIKILKKKYTRKATSKMDKLSNKYPMTLQLKSFFQFSNKLQNIQ